MLAFALVISVMASLLAGLAPALRAARRDIEGTLRDGRLMSAGAARDRTRSGLVVAEVALAFTLVVGASLTIRSLVHLSGLALGFDPTGVITARVTLPEAGYEEPEAVVGAFSRMAALLAARPGVESADAVSQAPLGPGGNENGLLPEGRSDEPGNRIFARLRLVTPGYLETMRIPLLRGRTLTEADVAGAERVMVVSEELARRAWPGVDPIGKRVICCEGSPADPRWKTVIGVVGDVLSRGPSSSLQPEFYLPAAQAPAAAWRWSDRTMTLTARASGPPEALAGTLRSVVAEVDPMVPAFRIRTMEEEMKRDLAGNRFHMLLLTILGGIGLTLAMVGVYSVVSYFVSLRTSEIGLRMALGASGADVLRLLAHEGMIPVLVGLAVGLGLALAATRLIQSSLFGVSAVDSISYAVVALLFVVIALAAILVPARRAVRIDPTRALQAE